MTPKHRDELARAIVDFTYPGKQRTPARVAARVAGIAHAEAMIRFIEPVLDRIIADEAALRDKP